jgi:hypothetical protein
MKDFYKHLNINSYSSLEWKLIKVSFSLIWFLSSISILYKYNFAPSPEGVFKLIPVGFYLSLNTKFFLFFINILLIYCYVFEKYFWWTLLGLSLISLFGFSLEDSNCDFDRNTMITGIFFAQFFAYSIKKKYFDFDIEKYRVQFSIQIIAVSYTLSGVAKLKASGLNWVTDGLMMPLQIMKTNYFGYVNDANIEHINNAHHVIELLSNYSGGVMFVLAFTLIIEFFAFLSIFNKKYSFICGILILIMHIGIYLVLDVAIKGTYLPMIIFMLNPLYLMWFIYISAKKKINIKFQKT